MHAYMQRPRRLAASGWEPGLHGRATARHPRGLAHSPDVIPAAGASSPTSGANVQLGVNRSQRHACRQVAERLGLTSRTFIGRCGGNGVACWGGGETRPSGRTPTCSPGWRCTLRRTNRTRGRRQSRPGRSPRRSRPPSSPAARRPPAPPPWPPSSATWSLSAPPGWRSRGAGRGSRRGPAAQAVAAAPTFVTCYAGRGGGKYGACGHPRGNMARRRRTRGVSRAHVRSGGMPPSLSLSLSPGVSGRMPTLEANDGSEMSSQASTTQSSHGINIGFGCR